MATARKPAVDPLVEELPPAPEEPKPRKAADVTFDVEISSYVVSGLTYYKWRILDHNAKAYVGEYIGHNDSGFHSADEAEGDAKEYIERIRHAVDLKLSLPDAYRIKL